MTYKKLLCYVSLLFLSSCASMKNNAVIPPAQLKELLKQNLVLLPDDKFENLPPSLKENEIIFLGEIHNVGPLIQAAANMAVYLANYRPVVYASESTYGSGLFLEPASLSNPKAAKPVGIPMCIQTFNSKQPPNRKILMTAIDIEHSIYHTKRDVVIVLNELASRSSSESVCQTLQKEIAPLIEQDTYDKMDCYLKKLNGMFQQHLDTFSPQDRDEILFYMELLAASNRYQYAIRGKKRIWQNPYQIRYRYFNKTIERAYQKTRKNKAILLCRVGGSHISSENKCERLYFAKHYSLTKGKVTAIQMILLYYDKHKKNNSSTKKRDLIDIVVKELMKDNKYSYLSLSKLQKNANNSFKWSKYYSSKGPKYGGLFFVKISSKPQTKLTYGK